MNIFLWCVHIVTVKNYHYIYVYIYNSCLWFVLSSFLAPSMVNHPPSSSIAIKWPCHLACTWSHQQLVSCPKEPPSWTTFSNLISQNLDLDMTMKCGMNWYVVPRPHHCLPKPISTPDKYGFWFPFLVHVLSYNLKKLN